MQCLLHAQLQAAVILFELQCLEMVLEWLQLCFMLPLAQAMLDIPTSTNIKGQGDDNYKEHSSLGKCMLKRTTC